MQNKPFVKLFFRCMLVLMSVLPLVAADNTEIPQKYEEIPVNVILFPFDEAIISSTVDGNILRYNYRPGERFALGAVIAEIDSSYYKEQFDKASSACDEAEKVSIFQQKLYEDNLQLFKKGILSETEISKNKLDMDVSQGRLKSAQAEKNLTALRLTGCKIVAPFAGRLESITIRANEFARVSQPIMTLINDTILLGTMYLPDNVYPMLKKGMLLKFKVSQNGKEYKGKVFEMAARIDHRSRTFEVKVLIENTSGELTAGMSGVLMLSSITGNGVKGGSRP